MTISEPDEKGKTARIELPPSAQPDLESLPESRSESAPDPENSHTPTGLDATAEPQAEAAAIAPPIVARGPAEPAAFVAQPVALQERETVFVPMSVNIGDGFKFGCGFFLALVVAMLVGFVLVAALFLLTSLFGLNLPITR